MGRLYINKTAVFKTLPLLRLLKFRNPENNTGSANGCDCQ
jgi:hypothetical protein